MSLKNIVSATSAVVLALAVLLGATAWQGQASAQPAAIKGASPAVCGSGDTPEPGVQGDVAAGLRDWKYNCGVKLVGELPLGGNVQGIGTCAYVRTGATIHVIDVSDPAKPVDVRSVPVLWGSESFRVVVAKDRSVMVSGSSVYDVRDCLNPVLKGEIQWPPIAIGLGQPMKGGGGMGWLPHDLRINFSGTKVYASHGLFEADITNLNDPSTWKVSDFRCDIMIQAPGPWQEPQRAARAAGMDLCADQASPTGANWHIAASGNQIAVLWAMLSHGLATSSDDKYVYIADQAAGPLGKLTNGKTFMRIIDVTQRPVKLVSTSNGPGHAVDWFRTGGRQYVLLSNELGSAGLGSLGGMRPPAPAGATAPGPAAAPPRTAGAVPNPGDPCRPYPRPDGIGWAFEGIISDVTDPTKAHNIAMLKIAINSPEHCAARKASGRDPVVGYHMIDDPMNAHFAMVNFGTAGLRFFDVRNPAKAVEVAYFNHGVPVHSGVGYYDAKRGLVYASSGGKFHVLELEPQVKAKLGL